ncbi:MAG: hypothetical protein N2318_05175 [Meiothermus sp.]|nr:hypothetical protein [Meiothermus sp.]
MQVSVSVAVTVSAAPLRGKVTWAEGPEELSPFTPGWLRQPETPYSGMARDLMRIYSCARLQGGLEAGIKAVLTEMARLRLVPPPNLSYPRLSFWPLPVEPKSPLRGFYELWQALQTSLRQEGSELKHFMKRTEKLAGGIGLLHPPSDLPTSFVRYGSWEDSPFQGDDSLWGWVRATIETRFWGEALRCAGEPTRAFLESLSDWKEGPRHPQAWQYWLEGLENTSGKPRGYISPFWPVGAALELLQLCPKRISERRVREYLRRRGQAGVAQVLEPLVGLEGGSEGPGYVGAFHLALLSLARFGGRQAVCAHCGAAFFYERKTARYCSDECRLVAFRERTRGEG